MADAVEAGIPDGVPLRERRTFEEEWAEFRTMILDPEGFDAVVDDIHRRIFYAGALTMHKVMMGGLDASREPTTGDVAFISQELEHVMAVLHAPPAEPDAR